MAMHLAMYVSDETEMSKRPCIKMLICGLECLTK